ncbi:gp84 [Mycobacterium phage Barnyard]|uniref:Uncharacterized protein n=1 Tax=Mycobacterium phage Barnyard TaxID=205880 RepID=Q855Y8_9CAUD|nr:gp84 [Mycobacterium phage Barnyard]AAN02138.1 hypothetical protein PBI_BARNYARD_84 [Mycobacterium phage Barnyard]
MKLTEFLAGRDHSHCKHCPHIFLDPPVSNPLAQIMPQVLASMEHWKFIATILHLATCHPDELLADTELLADIKDTYDLDLINGIDMCEGIGHG